MMPTHVASHFALRSQWSWNFAVVTVTWRARPPWIPVTLIQWVRGEEAGSFLFLPRWC